jgi:hypothetical protein
MHTEGCRLPAANSCQKLPKAGELRLRLGHSALTVRVQGHHRADLQVLDDLLEAHAADLPSSVIVNAIPATAGAFMVHDAVCDV